jgi:amino acid adenylation domain-containing protein
MPSGSMGSASEADARPSQPTGPLDPAIVVTMSNLCELLRVQAQRQPAKAALVDRHGTWSYRQLCDGVGGLIAQLGELGLPAGTAVCVETPRGELPLVAILAVLGAGHFYVPLDPELPARRRNYLIEDVGAGCVITGTAFGSQLSVRDRPRRATAGGDPLAYVIYTSGSTGAPKGVQVSHRNVLSMLSSCLRTLDIGENSVWSQFHSCSFDFSIWEVFGCIAFGGTLIPVPGDVATQPEAFLSFLSDHRVTVLSQVPSNFRRVMSAAGDRRPPPPLVVRTVIFGGEALDIGACREFRSHYPGLDSCLVNMYGITEVTVHATCKVLDDASLQDRTPGTPIGNLLPSLTGKVVRPDLSPCDTGEKGELLIGGAGVALGYLHQPELTRQRFVELTDDAGVPGVFYRSGDVVVRDGRGELRYLGRQDDQIKINGYRVEPVEIEQALSGHPAISSCAVTLVPNRRGIPVLGAAYVSRARPAAAELRRYLAGELPSHLVPAVFTQVTALPSSLTGKLDRSRLVALMDTDGPLSEGTAQ